MKDASFLISVKRTFSLLASPSLLPLSKHLHSLDFHPDPEDDQYCDERGVEFQ